MRFIVEFVGKVTKEGAPDFVPVAKHIATFDNGGTIGTISLLLSNHGRIVKH